MTQEIIEMAMLAGFESDDAYVQRQELKAFANAVAEAEREACAKLLEEAAQAAKDVDPQGFVWQAVKASAEVIRARGQA